MEFKIHYRITDDRAGIPQGDPGTCHFVGDEGEAVAEMAKLLLAADYQIPLSLVEICRIESCPIRSRKVASKRR